MNRIKEVLINSKTSLGIEIGLKRIKAVLIFSDNQTLRIGIGVWKNQFPKDLWMYSKEDILRGLQ